MPKFIAKPVEVEAFQVGVGKDPAWFLLARRRKQINVLPAAGTIVTKTNSGKINYYDPVTFNALFESVEESQDLDNNGVVDSREKAIATEANQKRKTKPSKKSKPAPSDETKETE